MESTLSAHDVDGQTIYFTDYVQAGAQVDLWEDPDEEQGFLGARVVERTDDGWALRPLTDAERGERLDRIRNIMGLANGLDRRPFPKGERRE